MNYEVEIGSAAEKEIGKLDSIAVKRVDKTINKLRQNPLPPGAIKLEGADEGWRVRVGDWRVIYEIDDSAKLVKIRHVRHRSEAYKKK